MVAAMSEQPRQLARGLVVRVKSDRTAFALETPDNWINLSKWLDPGTVCPAQGEVVTVGLDPRGYARSIVVENRPAVVTGPSNANLVGSSVEVAPSAISARDRLILRQVALKCAIDAIRETGDLPDTASVLEAADAFAAWLAMDPASQGERGTSNGAAER
jgi:hypothetical protein